jgi:hypothetical protein
MLEDNKLSRLQQLGREVIAAIRERRIERERERNIAA